MQCLLWLGCTAAPVPSPLAAECCSCCCWLRLHPCIAPAGSVAAYLACCLAGWLMCLPAFRPHCLQHDSGDKGDARGDCPGGAHSRPPAAGAREAGLAAKGAGLAATSAASASPLCGRAAAVHCVVWYAPCGAVLPLPAVQLMHRAADGTHTRPCPLTFQLARPPHPFESKPPAVFWDGKHQCGRPHVGVP